MDLVIITVIWAVVWGPDALDAWRKRKDRKRGTSDLRNVNCVEDIDWSNR